MRIYSLIVLLALPLAIRSCQPQGLPTVGDLVRAREVVTDSSTVIQRQGGYKGLLILGDDPDSRHGQNMKRIITGIATYGGGIGVNDISIPEKNIVFLNEFLYSFPAVAGSDNKGLILLVSREYETLRLSTRIVHVPASTFQRRQ